MTGFDWRELDRERVALAEAGLGPRVFYPTWRCEHAARLPVDQSKVHAPNFAQRRHQAMRRPWRVAS